MHVYWYNYIQSKIKKKYGACALPKNTPSNVYLQNAINKYGLENFILYILEFLAPCDDNLTNIELNIELIVMKQKYLDIFDKKYELAP